MKKPNLIIVTGRPGSGKTTFAHLLADTIYMQVISRDKIKEGYVHTMGKSHDTFPDDINLAVTKIFFDTLKSLLENNISIIAEAAFQHPVWAHMLTGFEEIANIQFVICNADDDIAFERFIKRGLSDPLRGYFHGDKGVQMVKENIKVEPGSYNAPKFDLPTHYVNTSDGYSPTLREITKEILGEGAVLSLMNT